MFSIEKIFSQDVLQKDIYFHENYLKVYQEFGDGKCCDFVFTQNTNIAIYPFLLNPINDLGFNLDKDYFDIQGAYGYNGVLTNSYEPFFIEKFYKEFDNYCTKNNIIAEFTRFHPLLSNHRFSQNHMQVLFDRETVALDLEQNYATIWGSEYSSQNRNMIRKAKNNGYSSKNLLNPSCEDIDQFISIYQKNMEMIDADKYYFFNNIFFYNTFSKLKDHVVLINIEDSNGRIVSSTIFFHYGKFFHYHLSGRTTNADNSINNFLLDEAVKFAQGLGAKTFHLGGGRSCAANDSLLKFKSNFSKTRLPFYIGKKIHNQEIYDKIVTQWEAKFPEKKGKYKNHLLKYRY